jgi:hypothetical protein
MVQAIGEADLGGELSGPLNILVLVTITGGRDKRRRQDVLDARTLRQERVVLEDEANPAISERRLLGLAKRVGS